MRLVAIAVGVVLLASSAAWAEDDARKIFERGTALFALHRFADAALQYEKAFELRPDAAILYNAAQAHRLAGNKVHALELYESLLRIYGAKVQNRVEITGHVRELRRAIDADRRATSAPPMTTMPRSAGLGDSTPVAEAPGRAVAPVALMVSAPPRVPVTQRKWFWPVIGGVGAVVVAGVVAVAVVFGTPAPQNPNPSFGIVRAN